MRTRLLLSIICFIGLAGNFKTASAGETAAKTVKIGAILYLTGDLAMHENAFYEGIQIAVEELNSSKGINGKKLELIVEDTKNDTKLSSIATAKFLNIHNVSAAILSSYQDAIVGGRLYEKAKTPALVLWDAAPEIDNMGDYIFSIGPWIPSAGETAARFSREKLKAKTAVVVSTSEEWSLKVSGYFKSKFQELGGSIVESFEVNPDMVDFRSIIAKAKASGAQMLYSPITYNTVPFYKQLAELNWGRPVLSSDIITDEHIKQSPAAFEGVYQTSIADPVTEKYNNLSHQYQTRFGKQISLPWFVATGYDSVMLIAEGIKFQDLHGLSIKDHLYKIKDFPGAGRLLTFNSLGSSADSEYMFQVKGGKFARVS